LDDILLTGPGRTMQCRLTALVLKFNIGASRQKQRDDIFPAE